MSSKSDGGEELTAGETCEQLDVTMEEIEAMRAANVKAGEELLATINRVAETQNYWKAELHSMLAQEAEEDERAREIFQEVMIGEAEAMANPKFMKWMAERQQFGVGREAIQTWFENDQLLLQCPYLAVVPFPRLLTPEGQSFVAETIDGLGLGEFVVETHRVNNDFCGRDFAAERAANSGRFPVLRSGREVLEQVQNSPALQEALEETACLFLNDPVSALRPEGVYYAQGFAVRGRLVAIQLSTDVQNAHAATAGAAVEQFFASVLEPQLQQRSFVFIAQVDCAVPLERPPVFLLNIGMLNVQTHGRFAWSDLMGAVMAGGDEHGRPIVRIATIAPADSTASTSNPNTNVVMPAAMPVPAAGSPSQSAPKHADPEGIAPSTGTSGGGAGHATSTLMAVAAASAALAVGASMLLSRRQ